MKIFIKCTTKWKMFAQSTIVYEYDDGSPNAQKFSYWSCCQQLNLIYLSFMMCFILTWISQHTRNKRNVNQFGNFTWSVFNAFCIKWFLNVLIESRAILLFSVLHRISREYMPICIHLLIKFHASVFA